MFDVFTSLALAQGVKEAVCFFTVVSFAIVLMPIIFFILGDMFSSVDTTWETPPEAYLPRHKRQLT